MSRYRLQYRPYRRRWRSPLVTHHGSWRWREGIILRLETPAGQVGYGEIAPLPWFGSESMAQAIALCQQCSTEIEATAIAQIPDQYPACQFGFASAVQWLQTPPDLVAGPAIPPAQICALLPTGAAAIAAWAPLWAQGHRTFKVKIGVQPLATELDQLTQLRQALPAPANLRLDANGGLSLAAATQWLAWCDHQGIEFLEQPLPPAARPELLTLAQTYATPIALDESVATFTQLADWLAVGWPGIMVVKAAIAGWPQRLAAIDPDRRLPLVFSTVFETGIGRWALIQQAIAGNAPHLAMGLGGLDGGQWFDDDWQTCAAETLWAAVAPPSSHPGLDPRATPDF